MNRQKQYLADNVDAMGNVFPTVGENIRFGAKNIDYHIVGITNYRIVKIDISDTGDVTTSENLEFYKTLDNTNQKVDLSFSNEVCISAPLLVVSNSLSYAIGVYNLSISENRIGIINCPFNTSAIFYFADKE